MPRPFEVRKEIEVTANPELIWEAIATGAGMDGWFVGTRNEVEPRVGGTVRLAFGDEKSESTVTSWDPPHRFAHQSEVAPDGSIHTFEFVIESRAGGRTLVRLVHSGFLSDEWEEEFDALNEGDFMYLQQLAEYVTYYRGRKAVVVTAARPATTDREETLARLRGGMGLGEIARDGDRVHITLDGLAPISGVVDFLSPNIIGVRGADALYRFLHVPSRAVYLGHHVYRDGVDVAAESEAWQRWLDGLFG